MEQLKRFFGIVSFLLANLSLCIASAQTPQTIKTPRILPNLSDRWQLEKNTPGAGMQGVSLQELQSRHVLFVTGFVNEPATALKIYYTDNVDEVKNGLGMTVSYYPPSSRKSVKENSQALFEVINKTYETYKKPMILVCHSKGGAECLFTILEHPNLMFQNQVDKVVIIQGAIRGSRLISWEWYRAPIYLSWLIFGNGFMALDPGEMKKLFDEGLRDYDEYMRTLWAGISEDILKAKYQEISNRIFYIRSVAEEKDIGLGTRLAHALVWPTRAALTGTDGLLAAEDQIQEALGVDLGILYHVDHLGLTISGIYSIPSAGDRKAFTRAMLAQVFSQSATAGAGSESQTAVTNP